MGFFDGQERKRREYQNLCPNRIWFHRHDVNQDIVAECSLVNDKYRWRIYGKGSKPIAEGSEGTLPDAMAKVLKGDLWNCFSN